MAAACFKNIVYTRLLVSQASAALKERSNNLLVIVVGIDNCKSSFCAIAPDDFPVSAQSCHRRTLQPLACKYCAAPAGVASVN